MPLDNDACDARLVQQLRARGVECMRAPEAGLSLAADADHLRHAAAHGLTLVTSNAGDFQELH